MIVGDYQKEGKPIVIEKKEKEIQNEIEEI